MWYKWILYGLMTAGLLLFFGTGEFRWPGRKPEQRPIRRDLGQYGLGRRAYGQIGEAIRLLLETSCLGRWISSMEEFLLVSLTGFTLLLLLGSMILPPAMSLGVALTGGALPGVIGYLNLSNRRMAGSKEGDLLVQELLTQYRMHSFNMREAIEGTAYTLQQAPAARRAMMNLARALNQAASPMEIDRCLALFHFAFHTIWSKILAANLFYALSQGMRVDSSLADLAKEMRNSRKVMEHRRRANYESVWMLKYLVPVAYALSVAGAVTVFGFSLRQFLVYQFLTTTGMTWFAAMGVCYGIGIVMVWLFTTESLDL